MKRDSISSNKDTKNKQPKVLSVQSQIGSQTSRVETSNFLLTPSNLTKIVFSIIFIVKSPKKIISRSRKKL